jgi:hypothetical protein
MAEEAGKPKHLDPALNAQRLTRVAEVATMLGIGRSTIYKYVGEGSYIDVATDSRGDAQGRGQTQNHKRSVAAATKARALRPRSREASRARASDAPSSETAPRGNER